MPTGSLSSFRAVLRGALARLRTAPRPALLALAALPVDAALLAQQWHQVGPDAREGGACCYDPVRRVTVMFGGRSWSTPANDRTTWEWNGSAWARRETVVSPPARETAAIAYDPVRGVCLLFGGYNAGYLTDTWQWNGVTWTQLAPAHVPPNVNGLSYMATDWARSRVVLAPANGTTWEWDGSDWLQIGSGTNPGNGPLAWDGSRGKVAAFVGNTHWEWTGTAWTSLGSTIVPSRYDHGLAYDSTRQRLCVFGGRVAGNFANDLWVRTGTTWQQVPPPPQLIGRGLHGCVFDDHRGRLVITAGQSYPLRLADTWEFDGTQWHAADVAPQPTFYHALASNPATGRMLLHGTLAGIGSQTFERIDGQWQRANPSVTPPHLSGGLAFDPLRNRFVYYGGTLGGTTSAAAFDWVQGNWVAQPGPTPPARYGHMMALDTARSRIVVFGGLGAQLFDDTWEWDGNVWTQVLPPTRPAARFLGGFAFDPSHGQLMLYGGALISYLSAQDTWHWTGTTWLAGPPGPGPRQEFAMATDPAAGRIVVHGGRNFGSVDLTDTREWNGTSWSLLPGGTYLSTKTAMAFDGEHMLLFGGVPLGGNQNQPSAATLRLRRTPATSSAYGAACPATAPAVTLLANDLPYAGHGGFGVTLANVPSETHTWVAASDSPATTPIGTCTLLIGQPFGIVYALASRAGVARHAVAIPSSLSLVGVPFYWQGFAFDPNGPVAGLVWSQGLLTQIGN